MTSFFFVVSIAYYTSVPALRKCMDTSRRKVFWLRVQPLVHRLLHLFVGPERIASHRLFERSKDTKVRGRGLASMADVEDTRRTDLGLLQQLNRQYGAKHCHVATKHLYSEVRVIWTQLQDTDDSLRDVHTLHCSQCSPWACSAPRLPLVHPKRESA
jgi:hypothetical protein